VLVLKKPVRTIFLVIAGIFMAGLLVSLFVYDPGLRIAGFGLVTLMSPVPMEHATARPNKNGAIKSATAIR
jgi:hypothetical protein